MSERTVIEVSSLGKSFRLYSRAEDRLKQLLSGGRRQHYEEFWALRNVTLNLRRGETLGVIGENGAGKSTLLRLICGTLRPTVGSVKVEGRIAALLELGSGFNPQFTGRENVWMSASVLGLSKAEIAARFNDIAEFAGIGDFMEMPVKVYSSGMQARLAFAVSAHVDADILILDEIMSVGDQVFRQKCMRYLDRFRARGTVLFVSHDAGTVARLCERALWLEQGQMRELGPTSGVCANYVTSLAERADRRESAAHAGLMTRWSVPPPSPVLDRRRRAGNRIELSDFNPDAPWHGHGGATIEDAFFSRPDKGRLAEIAGGNEVELRVHCRADRDLPRPIVGFMLRDRLGQNVFGDNTYLAYREAPRSVAQGDAFVATFRFQLPFLARGDYSLTVAITEGTQDDHSHIHWIEEALTLSIHESPVRRGIVGIPAKDVRIELSEMDSVA